MKVPEDEKFEIAVTHTRRMFGPIEGAPTEKAPAAAVTPSSGTK